MNRTLSLCALLLCFSMCLHAQKGKKKKVSDEQAQEILSQLFSDSTALLRSSGQQACNCIDSVDKAVKVKSQKMLAFSNCIDEQASAYQLGQKLLGSLTGKTNKIEINTDKNSDEHKTYYYSIERWLKDSCKTLNNAISANNEEREKSFSTNQQSLEAYDEGVKLLRKENYADAIPFFEKAVKIDSAFAFAWDNLGICYRRTGKLEQAEAAYKASIAIDPGGKTPLQNLGAVYQMQKRWDEAIATYQAILKHYPNDPEVYYGVGLIQYNGKDNMEEALQNMCKAYNIYLEEKSAYRSDAEKMINLIYSRMKKDNKEDAFMRILKENNISTN